MSGQPNVFDEDSRHYVHGAGIADPASPGATYVQAEVVALRTAIVGILAALRSAGIIAND